MGDGAGGDARLRPRIHGAAVSEPGVCRFPDAPARIDVLRRHQRRSSGTPPIRIQLSERYGLYGAAIALRAGGLSWRTLNAYVGCLFGLSMAFAYLLFQADRGPRAVPPRRRRLGVFGPPARSLDVSRLRQGTLFLALWLTLGWLWRRNAAGVSTKIFIPAAVGGSLLGLGLGFRPDTLVCVPPFVAVIAIGVRGFVRATSASRQRPWRSV